VPGPDSPQELGRLRISRASGKGKGALMKELLELIAKALVDRPEEIEVTEIEGEQTTVLELKVAREDLGKVIGKQGRTARSIRTILGAAGMKLRKRIVLEILE
jgi:predicted RNA-binding protein YlqC (UPF0109 family)